jgi:hypothetical protein
MQIFFFRFTSVNLTTIDICMRGKLFTKIIFIVVSLFAFMANGQIASFTSVPEATSGQPTGNGNFTINVYAGSQVLFISNSLDLNSTLNNQDSCTYFWDFDGANIGGPSAVLPGSSNIQGPHVVRYNSPGTYQVSLSIIGYSGPSASQQLYTQLYTFSVVVSPLPSSLNFNAGLVSGTSQHNSGCTNTIPFEMYQGTSNAFNVNVFQTVGTQNQCACSQGPTVSIPNVNLYPNGSNAYIYWGGPGNGPSAQATNNITTGPIALGITPMEVTT